MSEPLHTLDLPALDGANPLGFLAALGTLVTLVEAGEKQTRLGWKKGAVWRPYLSGLREPDAICVKLCMALRGRDVSANAENAMVAARKNYENAAKRRKQLEKAVKDRGLGRKELAAAKMTEVEPLKLEESAYRSAFLEKLNLAVPRPELSIGKKVDLSAEEFRTKAKAFFHDAELGLPANAMLAGLATESCNNKQCPRTRFDFVDSSGQLAFLEATRHLMREANPEKLEASLFRPWKRADEKYSLRFDPVEDRRYALLDRDPTAGNNKSTSEWMANLLAFRALSLFPCLITGRGSETTAWAEHSQSWHFTWPVWEQPLAPDTLRSLLGRQEFAAVRLSQSLRQIGVQAVYRSQKVSNGDYVNFSPAFAVL